MFLVIAAIVSATPASLQQSLLAARSGDTIKMSQFTDSFVITNKTFSPPLTISGGQYRSIVLRKVSGIILRDVEVKGSFQGTGYGIQIVQSSNVRIERATVTGAHRGIVIDRSTDFAVVDSIFTGLRSDGINIALSRRGDILRNKMAGFSPRPATYAVDGKLLVDGDHGDGIQLWSRPTAQPTADIQIVGNDIEGNVQCIFGGNHVRNGVDDGGFDRIVIEHNVCRSGMGNGISLGSARSSRVRFNRAEALQGSRHLRTGKLVKTQILLTPDDQTSIACGNSAPDVPSSAATRPCP